MIRLQISSLERVSSRAYHSAFCDLLDIPTGLLACYRQATNHVSGDGRIETCLIDSDNQIRNRQHLYFNGVDLRDPKLSYLPDGRILLIAYARHANPDNSTRFTQSVYWISQDGLSWSSPRYFGPKGWWLWRLSWHKGRAYGFAYNRAAQRVDLYAGNPLHGMDCIKPAALAKTIHGYGYPNESDIWFTADDTMHSLVRRDADSYSALYGTSHFPYTRWTWHDLKTYVGGPKVIPTHQGVLVGGRGIIKQALQTCIWHLNHNKTLGLSAVLPSKGDNSYPGLVVRENHLYALYYSSHLDNQSRVYIAKLEFK